MIYQFPYTDLYNLNLDWMIKAIKEMQEIVGPLSSVVNSVNGMTGDVVITRQFLMGILESMVSTFNGRDGAVTLTAADVNGTLIDITWTSDPGDVIGDLSQNTLNQLYADGKRVLIFVNNQGVPDTMYFLTLVGNVVTPQIYSPTAALAGVASFNGQTGAVTATGADLDTADDDPTPISESIGDLQTDVSDLQTDVSDLQTDVSDQSQQIDDLGPYNVLTSDSTTAALSAAQGKALKGLIDGISTIENFRDQIDTSGGATIIRAYKINHIVMIIGNTPAITDANVYTPIANVPVSYRVSGTKILGVYGHNTSEDTGNGAISIESNGNITIVYDKTTRYPLSFIFMYII